MYVMCPQKGSQNSHLLLTETWLLLTLTHRAVGKCSDWIQKGTQGLYIVLLQLNATLWRKHVFNYYLICQEMCVMMHIMLLSTYLCCGKWLHSIRRMTKYFRTSKSPHCPTLCLLVGLLSSFPLIYVLPSVIYRADSLTDFWIQLFYSNSIARFWRWEGRQLGTDSKRCWYLHNGVHSG